MEPLRKLLLKTADDCVIIGHRNSEWTGIGPVLEEDIAFSSMAQDKIGHAHAIYQIIEKEFGGADPDKLLYGRSLEEFYNSIFVELPIGDYSFTLARHYLFDKADQIRFDYYSESSFAPLSNLAKKIKGEIKYHVLHAEQWLYQLCVNGSEESKSRVFASLSKALPFAFSMFENIENEQELIESGVCPGELKIQEDWSLQISEFLHSINFNTNDIQPTKEHWGGRYGKHSEDFYSLMTEMREVYQTDSEAEW